MTTSDSTVFPGRPLTIALLAFSACGCSTLVPLPSPSLSPTAEAVRLEHRHEVYFRTDLAEPDATELARLDAFLATMPIDGTPRFRLAGRADERASDIYNLELSAKRAASVGRHVTARMGADTSVTTSALGEAAPISGRDGTQLWPRNRSVEIVATSYAVQLPECPDRSRDPAFDPRNLPLSGLGCANAVNLGLMVAVPADLEADRAIGPGDGVREAEAVLRYRSDKVKSLNEGLMTK